jgi:hypothetical protein
MESSCWREKCLFNCCICSKEGVGTLRRYRRWTQPRVGRHNVSGRVRRGFSRHAAKKTMRRRSHECDEDIVMKLARGCLLVKEDRNASEITGARSGSSLFELCPGGAFSFPSLSLNQPTQFLSRQKVVRLTHLEHHTFIFQATSYCHSISIMHDTLRCVRWRVIRLRTLFTVLKGTYLYVGSPVQSFQPYHVVR